MCKIKVLKKVSFFSIKVLTLVSMLLTQTLLYELISYQSHPDQATNVAQADAADDWYDAGWDYRKAITIDSSKVSGDGNLNDFPLLVSLTDANLKTVANGGHVQNANGYDIIFTNQAGDTKLDHELEGYDAMTGTITMWVRIPTLSVSVDTVIYIYYGNNSITTFQESEAGVWDSNFKMVQHLHEISINGVAGHIDSTGNANNGTPYNFGTSSYTTTNASGIIGGADAFDGADDYVDFGSAESLNIAGAVSVSMWLRPIAIPASTKVIIGRGGGWCWGVLCGIVFGRKHYIY